jgi:hypothetical protein
MIYYIFDGAVCVVGGGASPDPLLSPRTFSNGLQFLIFRVQIAKKLKPLISIRTLQVETPHPDLLIDPRPIFLSISGLLRRLSDKSHPDPPIRGLDLTVEPVYASKSIWTLVISKFTLNN